LFYFKAEGETQYRNEAVFLDLRNAEQTGANVTIDIPNNAVPGSESIHISAVGNNIAWIMHIVSKRFYSFSTA